MEISVTARNREYVPEWRGNRNDPKPIRATLRYLNTAQRMTLLPWRTDDKGVTRMEPDMKQLLIAGLVRLDDCAVTTDGERSEIRDGRELLATHGMEGLAIELASELISMNAREDVEKNS